MSITGEVLPDSKARKLTEVNLRDARKRARDYFWPEGRWAGFRRFFAPECPHRVGGLLIEHLRACIVYFNADAVVSAIHILNSEQAATFPGVICRPTEAAGRGVECLMCLADAYESHHVHHP